MSISVQTEALVPGEIESLPSFTRSFFEADPPQERFSTPVQRYFLGAKEALPIEIELDEKLGDWGSRVEQLGEELQVSEFIVPEKDDRETDQKRKETLATLYTIGYELGEGGLNPHLIDAISDRLMRQGIFYPQPKDSVSGIPRYRIICGEILKAGAMAKQQISGSPKDDNKS